MADPRSRNRKYSIAPPKAYDAFDFSSEKRPAAPISLELRMPAPGAIPKLEALLERPQDAAASPAQREGPPPAPIPAVEKRAVWIVHGMGQQLQFETLDGLAEGIMSVAHPLPGLQDFAPRVRAVDIGGNIVERVEIDVFENGRPLELHLYEAYWAPITEGQVTLTDVISFLFDGCFRGLLNSFKKFNRTMFGQMAGFKIHRRTAIEVLAALLTLLALIVLNAVIAAAGASAYGLTGHKLAGMASDWESLSAVASALSAVAIIFGAMIFLAETSKPSSVKNATGFLSAGIKIIVCSATWIAFALTLLAVIIGGLYLGYHSLVVTEKLALPNSLAKPVQGLATFTVLAACCLAVIAIAIRGTKRSSGNSVRGPILFVSLFVISFGLFLAALFGPVLMGTTGIRWNFLPERLVAVLQRHFWVWPFLILLSYEVRELLIQYVGDVAAYISPNKLDRFCEIRQKIKDVALKSASAVYLAKEDGDLLYRKIAVVGHSLGSVIAYDTLNALLNADALAINQFQVAERTCLLETFGSPLDKIAFFFTIQGTDPFFIREQLAASVQPLISDYEKYRQFPWINVYSKNDIVSGPVDFYDFPVGDTNDPQLQALIRGHAVQHIPDKDAIVPLTAHVDYWQNKEVWTRLCAELTR